MKKLIFKVLLIMMFMQVVSIFSCFDNCEQRYFKVLDIFIENAYRYNSDYFNVAEIPTDGTCQYDEFSIAIINGVEYYTSVFNFRNPFLSTLAACTEIPLAGERISNILVWSNADFVKPGGAVIPAGQYLNSLFRIDYRDDKSISIAEFLQGDENEPFEHVVYLTLSEVPANKQAHRFFVRYELDSGNAFSTSTERIYIEP